MPYLLNIIWDIDPEIFKIGAISIRYYSLCWLSAFIVGVFVLRKVYIKEKLDSKLLDSLVIYIFLGVLIGARLGHCLFYDFDYYVSHPLEMILPFGKDQLGNWSIKGYAGLASHGGIAGIIIAIFIYCWKNKVLVWDILDKLALVGPLGGACIRVGNFFNSEIIGKPTDSPIGIVFKQVDNLPRHPSQLYEAFSYILIFILVYYIYTRKRKKHSPGFVFGVTITFVFISRFLIEFSKIVQSPFEENLPIDMGQILSLPFIIIGVSILLVRYHPKKHINS